MAKRTKNKLAGNPENKEIDQINQIYTGAGPGDTGADAGSDPGDELQMVDSSMVNHEESKPKKEKTVMVKKGPSIKGSFHLLGYSWPDEKAISLSGSILKEQKYLHAISLGVLVEV